MISRRKLLQGSAAGIGTILLEGQLQAQSKPAVANKRAISSPTVADGSVAVLNGLRITLDKTSGSLLGLEYPGVGTMLAASSDLASMLSLAYPIPQLQPLRLESRLSPATIDVQDKKITIYWDRLEPDRKGFDYEGKVSGRVTLTASPDGRTVIWQCEVENHTSLPVPQVLFPDLRGLRAFDGVDDTHLDIPGEVIKPFEAPVSQPTGSAPYYTVGISRHKLALNWLNFGSLRGGFSLFARRWGWNQPSYEVLTRRTEANPEQLNLHWDNLPEIKPNQSWESYEFWMTPHTGGWAKGIDVFRAFVKESIVKRPPLPTTVREGLAFWSPWMTELLEKDPSRVAFRYADLPAMGKEAAEYGVTQIVPWRWNVYTQFPFTTNPVLGTEDEFLSGVRAIKSMGVGVSPFISIMLARKNVASRYGLKVNPNADWTYDPGFIPRFRPGYAGGNTAAQAGPWIPAWINDAKDIFHSWIKKGLCSFSWDQFIPYRGEESFHKLVDLFREVRADARKCDPQSSFSGENYKDYEVVGEVLDFTWDWRNYSKGWQIVTSVLPYPRLNANLENSPLDVKMMFMDNIYMNLMPKHPDKPNGTAWIHDFPALGAALKECAVLRKQFLHYFVEGNFLGSSVLATSSQAHVVGYQQSDSLLLVVLNPSEEERLTPRVAVQLNDWFGHDDKSRSLSLTVYDAQGRELKRQTIPTGFWEDTPWGMVPLELKVLEFRRIS